MGRSQRISAILVGVWLATVTAAAQDWRGMGRIAGKVTTESGAPVEGVVVKLALPASGNRGPETKSNKKGEWAAAGIGSGSWNIDFVKEGYERRSISVAVSEAVRVPAITVILKSSSAVLDPNDDMKQGLTKAAELMNAKQYGEARTVYEGLLARFPSAYQLEPLIARTYYGENKLDDAIAHLRVALAKDPANVEVKVLLGNTLIEKGNVEEGQGVLSAIDETAIKDPTAFVNLGIVLLNHNKTPEALAYFEKAIARFPDRPDAYYYRGIIRLQMGTTADAKADLVRFISMAPEAPEASTAKKILDQLGK